MLFSWGTGSTRRDFEGDTLSAVPLAIKTSETGIAVIFRYGVVVLIGMSHDQENDFIKSIAARVSGNFDRPEEETASI